MTASTTRTKSAAVPTPPTGAPVAPVAPVATKSTPYAEEVAAFRAALATIDAGDARGDAGATLKSLTLSLYRRAATKSARPVKGSTETFVPTSHRKGIALDVWNAAGYGEVPETAGRTPSAKSLAQYVARFGTVATNLEFGGMSSLASVDEANLAYELIRDAAKSDKDAAARRALILWINSLPTEDRDALTRAHDVLTSLDGATHTPAWIARVNADNKDRA